MARLVMVNGDQAGKDFALSTDREMVLGRTEECAVCVDNMPGISRRHALFSYADGTWHVEDLGSQNGIYINSAKVEKRPLADQDVMWFSNMALRFELAEASNAGAGTLKRPQVDPNAPGMATINTDSKAIGGSGASKATSKRAPARQPAADIEITPERIAEVRQARELIIAEFSKVIVGQRDVLEELLIALLSSGHCLMIGLPGLAKTLMISTLSEILDLKFKRIQFTPDLMPSDIIGSDILDMDSENGKKSFRFIQGPVFTNMLLADEINRTPPKTQAALLEAMQERQVTSGNTRFPLPAPFFVLATQNPLEQEGTYPLPEAQLDRFMFNILVDYPSEEDEEAIVMATTRKRDTSVNKVLTGAQLQALQDVVRELAVSKHVVKYATRLTRATRPGEPNAPDYIKEHVSCGAGPRAGQFLVLGAKARAVLDGRLNVSCEDVRALAAPILRHRIFTNFTADSEGITADDLVKRLLMSIPEPSPDDY